MENGVAIHYGGNATKSVNFSIAEMKLTDKDKHACFPVHSHPGIEVFGIISGEGRIPELDLNFEKGDVVVIPKDKKTKCGIQHSVEYFEDTVIWVATFQPPDGDFPSEENGLSMNKIISVIPIFFGG